MAGTKFSEIIKSEKPTLIDFYADWCGPCKMMSPILTELKNELGDKVTVIKIDVDKNQALAGSLDISGIPTLLLYKEGNVQWRQSGVVPLQQLKTTVKQYL